MSDTGKASDLLAQVPRGEKKGLPPAYLWNPPFCGDIDIRIVRDGNWFYLGTPIGHKSMVKLFSSIIRRDGGDYFPVTPAEKADICVDGVPFVVVTLQVQGEGGVQVLRFATDIEDRVEADAGHPLCVEIDPCTQEPMPYLRVRDNPEALVHHSVFHQLVELAVPRRTDGIEWLGVWSYGEFFPIGPQPD